MFQAVQAFGGASEAARGFLEAFMKYRNILTRCFMVMTFLGLISATRTLLRIWGDLQVLERPEVASTSLNNNSNVCMNAFKPHSEPCKRSEGVLERF